MNNGSKNSDDIRTKMVALFGKPQKSYRTPVLESPRLTLRPLKMSDAQAVFENWAGDEDAVQFMSWDVHRSVLDTQKWLETELAAVDLPDSYEFALVLKTSGKLIGSGGIRYKDEQQLFEIGYILSKKYWGLGLISEAAQTILDFAKNNLGMHKFYAFHALDNPASGKVLEKLGFVAQGEKLHQGANKSFVGRYYYLENANAATANKCFSTLGKTLLNQNDHD